MAGFGARNAAAEHGSALPPQRARAVVAPIMWAVVTEQANGAGLGPTGGETREARVSKCPWLALPVAHRFVVQLARLTRTYEDALRAQHKSIGSGDSVVRIVGSGVRSNLTCPAIQNDAARQQFKRVHEEIEGLDKVSSRATAQCVPCLPSLFVALLVDTAGARCHLRAVAVPVLVQLGKDRGGNAP